MTIASTDLLARAMASSAGAILMSETLSESPTSFNHTNVSRCESEPKETPSFFPASASGAVIPLSLSTISEWLDWPTIATILTSPGTLAAYEVTGIRLVTTASIEPAASASIMGGPYWKELNSALSPLCCAIPALSIATTICPFMPLGNAMRITGSAAPAVGGASPIRPARNMAAVMIPQAMDRLIADMNKSNTTDFQTCLHGFGT